MIFPFRNRRLLGLALFLVARPAAAQYGVWSADSLLAWGRLGAAESAYYGAVRASTRDPVARAALGRYLAARGGAVAGAVLIEEAMIFGGDSARLAQALVPIYARAGDYKSLAALKPNVLAPAELSRARWLSQNPTSASLRDSVVVLSYRPMGDGHGLGTILLRLGKSEIPAVIDPRVSGLVVPASLRRDLRTFGDSGRNTLAVAETIRFGAIVFTNVPATIGHLEEQVRVGLDVLAPYFPSFDPTNGLLILRRADRRAHAQAGVRVPALFDNNGLRLLLGGRWHPSSAAMPAMMLATRAWMWDGKLGDVVLLSP